MKITSITPEARITVEVVSEVESIEINTKCIEPIGDNALIVQAMKFKGEAINFKSDLVKLNIYISQDNSTPIIWKNVAISYISYMGKEYHRITAFSEGIPINRRNAFRLYIGSLASVQIGTNKMAYDVIIKDISSTGFSFVTPEDMDCIGEITHIVFMDNGTKFNVVGNVVRKQIISDRKIVYGCKTLKRSETIETYIVKAQRAKMQRGVKGRG